MVGLGVLLYRVDALLKDIPDLLFNPNLQKEVHTNKNSFWCFSLVINEYCASNILQHPFINSSKLISFRYRKLVS